MYAAYKTLRSLCEDADLEAITLRVGKDGNLEVTGNFPNGQDSSLVIPAKELYLTTWQAFRYRFAGQLAQLKKIACTDIIH